jgi:hypothetical protein
MIASGAGSLEEVTVLLDHGAPHFGADQTRLHQPQVQKAKEMTCLGISKTLHTEALLFSEQVSSRTALVSIGGKTRTLAGAAPVRLR